jgi:hypothetical protein
MPDVNLRHEIDCDEDTFWDKCFFNEEYLKRMFLEELKMLSFKILEQKDDGKVLTRRVSVDPPVVGIPGPVKKAIGDSLSYIEDGTFDRDKKRFTFRIIPSAFGEKAKINGEVWCEKLGDKKIARCAKMSVSVKVFMVGSFVEDKIVTDIKQSYAQAAKFTNEYVKEKGY